jgi:hypothetical protein
VRHDNNSRTGLTNGLQRLLESLLGRVIEVGVWLVEYNETRRAIESPRQGNHLLLSTRQDIASRPNLGIITIGHLEHHLMRADQFCGGDDLFRINISQAGNILGYRSLQELDFLRDIAQMRAQFFMRPIGNLHAIEANRSLVRFPNAHKRPRQTGLPGRTWTDHGE